MIRTLCAALLGLYVLMQPAWSADFSARARVLPDQTFLNSGPDHVAVQLGLSQGVPYRIFTLDEPRRLVVDFREVDWTGLPPERLTAPDTVSAAHFGGYRPGWSRLILDLSRPMALEASDLRIYRERGTAKLIISLQATTGDAFAKASRAPADPDWGQPPAQPQEEARRRQTGDGPLTVVLDPGHGGLDPGAQRGGVEEKELMLTFARELRDKLVRTGQIKVVLTRDTDDFVPLESRVTIAHEARADLFISLHADALEAGGARGATIYTLSDEASDEASRKLAERHNRADLLAGVDLSNQDDVVAHVLMDLARADTMPRSSRIADHVKDALKEAGAPLYKHPRREAGFSVLKAPDIPSILLELGFLSSGRDRENLTNPAWRDMAAQAITAAVLEWAIADAAEGHLIRQ